MIKIQHCSKLYLPSFRLNIVIFMRKQGGSEPGRWGVKVGSERNMFFLTKVTLSTFRLFLGRGGGGTGRVRDR